MRPRAASEQDADLCVQEAEFRGRWELPSLPRTRRRPRQSGPSPDWSDTPGDPPWAPGGPRLCTASAARCVLTRYLSAPCPCLVPALLDELLEPFEVTAHATGHHP